MYSEIQPKTSLLHKIWNHFLAHKLPYFWVFLLLGLLGWLLVARYHDSQRFETEKQQMAAHFETISNDHLRLTAKTFSWAVRSALMRGNYDQVREYFQDFIQEEKIRSVALSDMSGKITICTDLNFEGKQVAELFPGITSNRQEIFIAAIEKKRIVSTPILSLNEPLGTLWWSFEADSLQIVGE